MKYYIEVGSTVTKCDKWSGSNLIREKEETIFFKKHYEEKGSLDYNDVDKLVSFINELGKNSDIKLYGTSLFRKLSDNEFLKFSNYVKNKTGLNFKIVSQEDEGLYTGIGASYSAKQKVAVMIGGGGSTELLFYDNKLIETNNNNIGVMDVLKKFPDLANDIADTSLEEVMDYIKNNIKLPENKADVLILAGGGHGKFARQSGISYEKNTLYDDSFAPIMMDIETRIKDTNRYFKEISLDAIRAESNEPNWWNATRAMCAFVLVLAEAIGANYIVPTDIAMAHGLIRSNI